VDVFELEINRLTEELQKSLGQMSIESTMYEKRDEKVDEMLPYWEAYPSIIPVANTYVTSPYGYRKNPFGRKSYEFHSGVDFKARYQDVWASGSGIVTYAGYNNGYGYMIIIDHGYGLVTKYAHNSKLKVEVGDLVERYDVIAKSGNSGRSSGPHLHYEVLLNGETQNPLDYIDKGENDGQK
jgi:murein DD-endopeptidase MepM/ murein hydrolase activator NlpD